MKAETKGLRHEVKELDETITRHIGKDAARWQAADKKAQAENPGAAGTAPGPHAAPAPTVPRKVWDDAGEAQRRSWANAGMLPAGKAS